MEIKFRLTRRRLAVAAIGCALVSLGGVGYAAITDPGVVITACMQKSLGTIRMHDATAPATSLLGRPCNAALGEVALSWNQHGIQGIQGLKGDRGDQGTQGLKGDKGDQGTQGVKGDKGDQGTQGLKGDRGDQGTQGLKGDKGDQGTQGLKGDKGDQGTQGLKGDNGDQGTQGLKGDKGDQGTQGLKGDKGDTGAQGLQGVAGVAGVSGVSGYELVTSAGPVTSTFISGTTISCPAGKLAIGGGTYSDSLPGGYHIFTLISAPTDDGTGWRATVENDTGSTVNITQYAVCVNGTS